MQIIAGPLLPEAAWQSLHAMARGLPGLTLHRCIHDLGAALRGAVASISQCGYNPALHLVQGRVPALVVPFADGREDTQLRRARRLEHLGAVRVLDARDLNGPTWQQKSARSCTSNRELLASIWQEPRILPSW